MLKIRKLLESGIIQLKHFPPDDWELYLPKLIFYIAAEVDERIVGCGIAVIQGAVGWLGAIIVLQEYRRQGIGQEITSHLLEYCNSKGCKTQLLKAAEMGEPVYRKLGFKTSALYVFYKCRQIVSDRYISNVRRIVPVILFLSLLYYLCPCIL